MPVVTRKRKAAEQPAEPAEPQQLINPSSSTTSQPKSGITYKDDDPFEAAFDTFNKSSSEGESDVSDYNKSAGSRTTKRRTMKKRVVKKSKMLRVIPGPAPQPPELSDHELGDDEEEDSTMSTRRMAPTPSTYTFANSPSIIRLELGGNTTLDLNLAELIRQNALQLNAASPLAGQAAKVMGTSDRSVAKDNLFMRLPPELRNRVYRMVLVTDTPIVFHMRSNFERSGQFLRACRDIAQEGADVMYGENSFHFERTAEKRGKFWEKTWKEVGFKDIRRFLETIGPANVSKLKYLSFSFEDGIPYLNPGLDLAERRFVNDPVLHRVFDIISANAVLSRIDVAFCGRSQVQLTDYHFLKSLSGIRSPSVKFPKSSGTYPTRVNDAVLDKLVPIMSIPDADVGNIDKAKIKKKIKMFFDQPTKASYSNFGW